MAQVTVQVLSLKTLSGTAKGSGKPYSMDIATVVVRSGEAVSAGELILPKDHGCQVGGVYVPDFAPTAFQGRVEFGIVKLSPVPSSVSKAA